MILISNQMMIILLVLVECKFKMIEIYKIMLICAVFPGQVYCKVMMDIHRKINMDILLQVINISKQQKLSFMELIHK